MGMRKHALASLFACLLSLWTAANALAAACTPIPALPDTERRTQYTASAQTGPFNVGFQIYGDGTDFANWIGVYVNGVLQGGSSYTVTSPTTTLATGCRPISDAQVTFTSAQTGTVQIVGAQRPRRLIQVTENQGVTAHDFNQFANTLTAMQRERWDQMARTLQAPPGETLSILPAAASRANQNAIFDALGNLTPGLPVGGGATVSSAMQPVVSAASIAVAQGLLGINAGTNAPTNTFATRTAAVSATIGAGIQIVATTGFAATGDGGDAVYSRGGSLQPCGFQSADGAFWQIVGYLYNWKACGATGLGVADDSTAIQASINGAQLTGGVSFGPPGSYKVAVGLSITGRVSFWGVGYEGSAVNVSATTGYKSTTLVCGQTINCISVSTPSPVLLERFQITYPLTPTVGTAAITLDAPGGGTIANVDSVLRDIQIIGADIGVKTVNAGTFTIDRIRIDGAKSYSAYLQWVNQPGSGDSNITNSIFSGGPSAHLNVLSGGGLRIVNNKLNSPNLGIGIAVVPNQVTSQGITPFFVANNSIEGTLFGMLFQRGAGITETVGPAMLITGNEFIGSTNGIAMQASATNPTVPWILGGTISGNYCQTGSGQTCFGIGGASTLNLVGNTCFGGGSTCIAIDPTTTDHIGNTGNNKGAGVL